MSRLLNDNFDIDKVVNGLFDSDLIDGTYNFEYSTVHGSYYELRNSILIGIRHIIRITNFVSVDGRIEQFQLKLLSTKKAKSSHQIREIVFESKLKDAPSEEVIKRQIKRTIDYWGEEILKKEENSLDRLKFTQDYSLLLDDIFELLFNHKEISFGRYKINLDIDLDVTDSEEFLLNIYRVDIQTGAYKLYINRYYTLFNLYDGLFDFIQFFEDGTPTGFYYEAQ